MTERNLLENLKEIKMPEDMKARLIKNCDRKAEEPKMSTNKEKLFVRKPIVTAASLVLCLCLTGVTVLGATGKLQGFFKDVKHWDGAVVGTAYEHATDEIEVKMTEAGEVLTLEISMVNANVAPYNSFEMFGVADYKIVDMDGMEIVSVDDANIMADVIAGKAVISIPLNELAAGEYQLMISEMSGNSKAEQPLMLSGIWEIEFIK